MCLVELYSICGSCWFFSSSLLPLNFILLFRSWCVDSRGCGTQIALDSLCMHLKKRHIYLRHSRKHVRCTCTSMQTTHFFRISSYVALFSRISSMRHHLNDRIWLVAVVVVANKRRRKGVEQQLKGRHLTQTIDSYVNGRDTEFNGTHSEIAWLFAQRFHCIATHFLGPKFVHAPQIN